MFGFVRTEEVKDLKAKVRDLDMWLRRAEGRIATLESRVIVLTELLAGRTVRFVRLHKEAFAAEEVIGIVEQVSKAGEVVVRDAAGVKHTTHILDVTNVFHKLEGE